jgi:hypothetical protein
MDSFGNYIVSENVSHNVLSSGNVLSRITPAGTRTVIYNFTPGSQASAEAIDSEGNYIVTEYGAGNMNGGYNVSEYAGRLSKITPDGVRTVIANLTAPNAVAIDQFGNYIVTQTIWPWMNLLSKVTPEGNVSVIYSFPQGQWPAWVAIDSSGNYIVTAFDGNTIWKVTPAGVATPIAQDLSRAYSIVIDSEGNYIVSLAGIRLVPGLLMRVTPAGVETVLYKFPTHVGEIQVISPGDLGPATTTTVASVTPTSTTTSTSSMTTRVSPTSTATASSASSTSSSQATATGGVIDSTIYAVAGVVAVGIVVAAAALALRRRH